MRTFGRGSGLLLAGLMLAPGFLGLWLPASAGLEASPLEVIIAPDSFVVELLPLKAWRESQGIRVDIVTTTYIQGQIAGPNLPESIKTYIDRRAANDSSLKYVLLAADDPIIPGRLLQVANRTAGATMSDPERSLTSDFYYAVPSTNFLNSSDMGDDWPGQAAWYGISDSKWNLTPTIHVGRIPISTVAETRDYVSRLIAFEQSPPSGIWASRAVLGLGVASVPDSTFGSRRLGDDAGVAFAAVDARVSSLGLVNIALRDYPAWPSPYDSALDRLDGPTFLGEWGLGASLVVLAARDNPAAVGPGEAYSGDGNSSLFSPPAPPTSFSNLGNSNRLPVFIAAYGGSANFSLDNNSNIERAVVSSNGGAALAIGFTGRTASGVAPGGPMGGWTLAAAVANELLTRPGPIGDVMDAARARFLEGAKTALGGAFDANNASLRRAIAGLTLLGDPASRPFVGLQKALDISFVPGVSPNASVALDVTATSQGAPVANATVALVDETGELQATAVTDGTGVAQLTFSTGARATWRVSVTAAGYLQASRPLAIDSPPHVVIITPGNGSSVAGALSFTGLAGDPDTGDSIAAVEVALNGFNWTPALGTNAWSFFLDTALLANGPNTFSARANDGTVWSAAQTVTFNVTNPKPPVLVTPYPEFSVREDAFFFDIELSLQAHFAASGPTALLNATVESDGNLTLLLADGNLTVIPRPNYHGLAHFNLTVSDSFGGRVTLTVAVRVTAVDDPPSLTVGSNFTVEEGGTVNFNPVATDPDGTLPLVYLESGPANATVTGWQTPRGSEGPYTLVIAATDGRYIARAFVVVTVVSHNAPPTAQLVAPAVGEAGKEVQFSAEHVADADNDSVTFEWDFGDGQVDHGRSVSHVYAIDRAYTVTLTVSDGRQSTVLTKSITIEPYRPPAGPPSGLTAALGLGSLAVIAACAALACYLLFLSPRRGDRAGSPKEARRRRGEDEEE